MRVRVKLLNEEVTEYELAGDRTVGDLKADVEARVQIARERQKLIYQGRVLPDEGRLQDQRIEEGSTIYLIEQRVRRAAASLPQSAESAPMLPGSQSFQVAPGGMGIVAQISLDDAAGGDLQSIFSSVFRSLGQEGFPQAAAGAPVVASGAPQAPAPPPSSDSARILPIREVRRIQHDILTAETHFRDLNSRAIAIHEGFSDQRILLSHILSRLIEIVRMAIHPIRQFHIAMSLGQRPAHPVARQMGISLRKISYFCRLCSNILENEMHSVYTNVEPSSSSSSSSSSQTIPVAFRPIQTEVGPFASVPTPAGVNPSTTAARNAGDVAGAAMGAVANRVTSGLLNALMPTLMPTLQQAFQSGFQSSPPPPPVARTPPVAVASQPLPAVAAQSPLSRTLPGSVMRAPDGFHGFPAMPRAAPAEIGAQAPSPSPDTPPPQPPAPSSGSGAAP